MTADEFLNSDLKADKITTMQVNLGNLCNLACRHCHVNASPRGKDNMSRSVAEILVKVFKENGFHTLDLTGGAPEMNENFRFIIESLKNVAKKIIVRTNLVILNEDGFNDLAEYFAKNGTTLVASLPCYTVENVDKQRGDGVFEGSIKALKKLNSLGYGKDLELNLVYNPNGAFLPGDQKELENDYKKMLKENFDIEFSELFTITNMPIGRFKKELLRDDKLSEYMELLKSNFNQTTIPNLMCKNQISVGFDGKLYNCDFNQMLGLELSENLENFTDFDGKIIIKPHCLACTAGAGSSCGGALE
ncbi:arsenosugar biosynthesis radical SAM (seleno)protein ArsS [Campylobacter corcagiensis]|uniref:Arsenosugar biosynthesis radical SAM protein ArsS n=1 Tax=Campylobacter corcagiensis TaxID=1448857 RepID=A0A7M1LFJ5_9BACT|nr:arsenosugar biosynthesis radical SAM (seleno)protein ArsS [Campylobacter corcagiensis]QKF64753.1 radical SAM/Cys-rich domain protein [Campylobacter corcagiensis]QOQ87083.1 arsenosugar biosynthesis radical SAM protein ArsS [Campylobacter corcagiensis]